MADKKKTSDKQDLPHDQVQDAVILEDQAGADPTPAPEAVTADQRTVDQDPVEQDTVTVEQPDTKPNISEPDADMAEDADTKTPETSDISDRSLSQDAEALSNYDDPQPTQQGKRSVPAETQQPVVVRKGGFIPMVLGGVVAAIIGIAVARSGALNDLFPMAAGPEQAEMQQALSDMDARISALDGQVSDLSDRLTALESTDTPDLAPALADLSAQLDDLTGRIATVEDRPTTAAGDGAMSDATTEGLAATQTEIQDLRQLIETQQADIAALRAEAIREEEAEQLSAELALQRAALARIQSALDSGTDYTEAVTDLRDAALDVPQPLADRAETGVATLSSLQSSFPDLAREALTAARQAQGATGVTAFLQTQLGLRSLSAREGNDPDAVLSRAEAALQQGRLPDTLTELDALPEPAQAVFTAWRAQAEARIAALAAAQDLSQSLNTN